MIMFSFRGKTDKNFVKLNFWESDGWLYWLRQYATRQKVASSIPDFVIGMFDWHNPSGLIMALGSTQPLTEMSTGNVSLGVRVADA